jgi:hypothetical protein
MCMCAGSVSLGCAVSDIVKRKRMRLPRLELGSTAWQAAILPLDHNPLLLTPPFFGFRPSGPARPARRRTRFSCRVVHVHCLCTYECLTPVGKHTLVDAQRLFQILACTLLCRYRSTHNGRSGLIPVDKHTRQLTSKSGYS